jgi:hypothetical protein
MASGERQPWARIDATIPWSFANMIGNLSLDRLAVYRHYDK